MGHKLKKNILTLRCICFACRRRDHQRWKSMPTYQPWNILHQFKKHTSPFSNKPVRPISSSDIHLQAVIRRANWFLYVNLGRRNFLAVYSVTVGSIRLRGKKDSHMSSFLQDQLLSYWTSLKHFASGQVGLSRMVTFHWNINHVCQYSTQVHDIQS